MTVMMKSIINTSQRHKVPMEEKLNMSHRLWIMISVRFNSTEKGDTRTASAFLVLFR